MQAHAQHASACAHARKRTRASHAHAHTRTQRPATASIPSAAQAARSGGSIWRPHMRAEPCRPELSKSPPPLAPRLSSGDSPLPLPYLCPPRLCPFKPRAVRPRHCKRPALPAAPPLQVAGGRLLPRLPAHRRPLHHSPYRASVLYERLMACAPRVNISPWDFLQGCRWVGQVGAVCRCSSLSAC